jgi:acyl dehydratase
VKITFSKEQIARYAEASGDQNPIHLDEDFARSVGLPGVIAHGMLQMGLVARAAVDAAGGDHRVLKSLSCRFADMVQPGDTVDFEAERENGRIRLTATNQDGKAVLTKAAAELFQRIP